MKVAAPLPKDILAPLAITAASSAIDAGIQNKIHGSETMTFQMKKLMIRWKLSKLLKILIFYWKALLKSLKMKQKNKKDDF